MTENRWAVRGPWHPVAVIQSFCSAGALRHHVWLLENAWSQLSTTAPLTLSHPHCGITSHGVNHWSCTCTVNAVHKRDRRQDTRAAFLICCLAVKELKVFLKVSKSLMKEVEIQELGSLILQAAFLSKTRVGLGGTQHTWHLPVRTTLSRWACPQLLTPAFMCPPSWCQVKTSYLKQTPEYTSSRTLRLVFFSTSSLRNQTSLASLSCSVFWSHVV